MDRRTDRSAPWSRPDMSPRTFSRRKAIRRHISSRPRGTPACRIRISPGRKSSGRSMPMPRRASARRWPPFPRRSAAPRHTAARGQAAESARRAFRSCRRSPRGSRVSAPRFRKGQRPAPAAWPAPRFSPLCADRASGSPTTPARHTPCCCAASPPARRRPRFSAPARATAFPESRSEAPASAQKSRRTARPSSRSPPSPCSADRARKRPPRASPPARRTAAQSSRRSAQSIPPAAPFAARYTAPRRG